MTHSPQDDRIREILEEAFEIALESEYEEALECLNDLEGMPLRPEHEGRLLAIQIVCLEQLDEARQADALHHRLFKGSSGKADRLLAAGVILGDLGDLARAENALRAVCRLCPKKAAPWAALAIVLGLQMEFKKALEALERAEALEPGSPAVLLQKARLLGAIGRLEEAAKAYCGYLKAEPDDAERWFSLAGVEADRGEFEAADAAFERAVGLEPESPDFLFYWAAAAWHGRLRERSSALERALAEMAPHDWRSPAAKAFAADQEGRADEAWKEMNVAFRAVCDEGEPEEVAVLSAIVLEFARHQGREKWVGPLIHEIFEQEVFTGPVLSQLRLLENPSSSKAKDYLLLVQGERVSPQDGERVPYLRPYRVLAENRDQARAFLQAFEARCPEPAMCTNDSTEVVQIPGPAALGVCWRGEAREFIPEEE